MFAEWRSLGEIAEPSLTMPRTREHRLLLSRFEQLETGPALI
jgi:hypothetical protein